MTEKLRKEAHIIQYINIVQIGLRAYMFLFTCIYYLNITVIKKTSLSFHEQWLQNKDAGHILEELNLNCYVIAYSFKMKC